MVILSSQSGTSFYSESGGLLGVDTVITMVEVAVAGGPEDLSYLLLLSTPY